MASMARSGPGGRTMAVYRLYYIQDARLTGTDEIEASGDAEAFALAEDRGSDHMRVEVWRGGRKIHETGPAAGADRPERRLL